MKEKDDLSTKAMKKIRQFDTGATRDTEENKLDYAGFLSPAVLKEYAKYMHRHRIQSDGKLRDSDNWKKHFGKDHYEICIKSLLRHVMDLWLEEEGFASRDGIEDALMGIMFNVMAYADKYYRGDYE